VVVERSAEVVAAILVSRSVASVVGRRLVSSEIVAVSVWMVLEISAEVVTATLVSKDVAVDSVNVSVDPVTAVEERLESRKVEDGTITSGARDVASTPEVEREEPADRVND
jgi:hypothetical protein